MIGVWQGQVQEIGTGPVLAVVLAVVSVVPGQLRVVDCGAEHVSRQDTALGLYVTENAGGIVESHVLGDRRVKSGEIHPTEIDGVSVGGPLSAVITVASAGQLGRLVQPRSQELHHVIAHERIIGDGVPA
ncbi:hypothetical protein SAMN02745898_106418 [Streptomyces sp. 136MFCol5.1]|nr:hypothetical protein SAMN02745898_106418 [Streptomyces sp. 136MFCol5.1]